ncbi:MAG TPA: zinc ribbon domain-containing protein [Acetobacteraceae bacterium]|nr:zinc ribbon domain-containing protein [Acetobacteraceae bacterium]
MTRLLLQRCATCGMAQYPPRENCVACLSDRLAWDSAAEFPGTVVARITLYHSFEPHFRPRLPLSVGLVQFDAGPVAICFLASAANPGDRVQVREQHDEVGHPVLEAAP